jgi:hypothetical protein
MCVRANDCHAVILVTIAYQLIDGDLSTGTIETDPEGSRREFDDEIDQVIAFPPQHAEIL